MEDPPTITLKLPRQDKAELQLFQANSESARDWVQALPVSDTRSVVQLLDQAFDDLNRTRLSPDIRYSLMEILLPSLEVALTNLARRFLNQPLIMPAEPRKMAESSNQMYSMAVTGYTIVALEAIQQPDTSGTNPARLTCQAIQRALMFGGRKILQAYQLHQPMEPSSWEIQHQLYALAEYQKLVDLPVTEPLAGGSSIRATYLQAAILSCCKPNQLRQSDLTALYRGLQQWAELVQVNSRETDSELFLVDLNNDQPPQYRVLYRGQLNRGCRTLDTSALIEYLKTLRTEIAAKGASFDQKTSISSALLDHLIASLGSMSMRNFKRTASNSPLWVCVGLSNTHYQVARQQMLKQAQDGDQRATSPGQVHNNPFMPSLSKGDLWAKANPLKHYDHKGIEPGEKTVELDAATRSRLLEEGVSEDPRKRRQPVFEVQLADTSANGYCLEWLDELPGDLKAGDLVGVKEDKQQNEWSIAVIRWLSRMREARTLLGLELLSPRAIAYSASIHRSGGDKTSPMKVLLLPEIKIVGQPNTLITPRAGFKEKQKVTLRNNTEKQTIQLMRQISSTGSFEQFEFRYIKELGDILAENQDGKMSGEFDSLWSNI